MGGRTVVYRADPKSEAAETVAARLRAGGLEIVDEQPNMLLVNGAKRSISKAVAEAEGWSITVETTTPPPRTRLKVLKRPK